MVILPEFAAFARKYDNGEPQAVYMRLVADLETPVSAYLKLAEGRQNALLLESVQGGETRGRYSIIAMKPDVIWRCRDGKSGINRQARSAPDAFAPDDRAPLASLRALLNETRMALPEGVPPMAVGIFGYLGYDMVRLIERLPNAPPDTLGLPDAILIRPTITAIFDNVRDEILIVSPVWPERGIDARAAYARAGERLNDIVADLERPLPAAPVVGDLPALAPSESNMTHDEYLAMVDRAKEYIRAGDIFQVVPSQRFRRPFTLPSLSLYRALRRLNPSPFLYHLAFPGFAIVGSSPEILVRLRDGVVTIRPIAGTRPRGATTEEDKRLADELVADPKERAEHLMLVDLGRNDVGRVAQVGEVHVTDSFFIERYSHVMHLVSNVEGKIRPGLDAVDALAAGLPAGTLSGAPKIRAMQIIDEFEREKRGAVYAGAVGYFAADGSMDTCIVLRTAVVKDGMMYVQAGGGIVADSVPEAEYQETVNKAKALMSAAEEAVRFASAGKRGQ
ncbi:MAG: anthranilate synthase component I [Alphaproteobacteria bacterium]|nr:anthranilate synthase component I [Alphaproteobacteria bacterium]